MIRFDKTKIFLSQIHKIHKIRTCSGKITTFTTKNRIFNGKKPTFSMANSAAPALALPAAAALQGAAAARPAAAAPAAGPARPAPPAEAAAVAGLGRLRFFTEIGSVTH